MLFDRLDDVFEILWQSRLPHEDLLEVSSIFIGEPVSMIQEYWDVMNEWIQVMGIEITDDCKVGGMRFKEWLNGRKKNENTNK